MLGGRFPGRDWPPVGEKTNAKVWAVLFSHIVSSAYLLKDATQNVWTMQKRF